MTPLLLSRLPHTWLIDVDGTIFTHNGHKRGPDQLLPGVREFWDAIPAQDTIILLSARTADEAPATEAALRGCGLRYDQAIFGLPTGERVLVNDRKPGGLVTARCIDIERDAGLASVRIDISDTL
jgi:hypothetical protein